jgi:hypothetical protein
MKFAPEQRRYGKKTLIIEACTSGYLRQTVVSGATSILHGGAGKGDT